jgi:hypothetical protein
MITPAMLVLLSVLLLNKNYGTVYHPVAKESTYTTDHISNAAGIAIARQLAHKHGQISLETQLTM